jgi:hypothetical protein
LVGFLAAVSRQRRKHPTFRRTRFFEGRPVLRGLGQLLPDIVWLDKDASAMVPEDWDNPLARALGVFYNGAGVGKDHRGRVIHDHNFLLYCNSGEEPVVFTIPSAEYSPSWEQLIDTAGEHADTGLLHADETVELAGRSLLVLRFTPARPRSPTTRCPPHWPCSQPPNRQSCLPHGHARDLVGRQVVREPQRSRKGLPTRVYLGDFDEMGVLARQILAATLGPDGGAGPAVLPALAIALAGTGTLEVLRRKKPASAST